MNLESSYIDEKEILIRIFVAAVLGAVVGFEREQKEWVAGLRTHIIVTVGAALAMIVSTHGYEDVLGKSGFDVDPSRVAAQVVSGVGFLGAGTIIFLKREVIKGLTTAASIWSLAVVGLAVGGGMYWAAAVSTFLILFVLGGIKWIDRKFFSKDNCNSVEFKTKEGTFSKIAEIDQLFKKHNIPFEELSFSVDQSDNTNDFTITFGKKQEQNKILKILEEMQHNEQIIGIRFKT